MDQLSSLNRLAKLVNVFDRRQLAKGILAGGIFPAGILGLGASTESISPVESIRQKRYETLVAIMAAQIDSLWGGQRGDDPEQVADEFLRYASHLPERVQKGLDIALLWLDVYSLKHTMQRLHTHSHSGVRQVINQGESRFGDDDPPLICWDEDHMLHMAASGVAMLGRLVIHSRRQAREFIGLSWSETCQQEANLVSVAAPPLADLNEHYDAIVIGSGAGGATAANRLSAQGRRVLILDYGDFVSPDALIQRVKQSDGSVRLAPPRSDDVLINLYKDAGAQISGGLNEGHSKLELLIPQLRKKIIPQQTINICQAKVFGGGPYVNNAIHLPISKEVYESKWADRCPDGVSYEQFASLMDGICNELGVNIEATESQISDRSMRFAEGCQALGEEVQPLPVAIRRECTGCGSDNSVDSFGDHIGGVHPYAPGSANSFLVQAMNNPTPADVSYCTEAKKIQITSDNEGQPQVTGVAVQRQEADGTITNATVTADEYIVAAGTGPTTRLISQGLMSAGCPNEALGKRFTANVGTAVYAMFDKPIWTGEKHAVEPGVTQCFLVDRKMVEKDGELLEEPVLENWFHFPGTVALALTGWFKEFATTMRKFNHLSMAGIVVPTQVRDCNRIDESGKIHLTLDKDEFELLLRGIKRIGRIYFAAAKEDDRVTLHLPTKAMLLRGGRPLRIRDMNDLDWAIKEIRRRGPAFVNLLTTHGQGGASLGDVVDPQTFQVKTDCGENVKNLTIADASLFPAGCEINPQLTLKALATLASEQVIERTQVV